MNREPEDLREEAPLEGIERAWGELAAAVEAHAAVGLVNDPYWVHGGLLVVRRRALAFVKELDALIEVTEH